MSRFILVALVLSLFAAPVFAQGAPVPAIVAPGELERAAAAEAAAGSDAVVRSTGVRADFTLTSIGDVVDANPGDGICATAGALCTLRAAVMEANALGGSSTITVPVSYAIVLTLGAAGNDNADSGDLDITSSIAINGPSGGFPSSIRNAIGDRIFHVIGPSGSLTIANLMLRESGGAAIPGGAVYVNNSTFTADRISVYSNAGSSGGGLLFVGTTTFTIANSTIAYNTGYNNGGGIHIQNGPTGTIVNSTIVGNFSPLVSNTSFPGAGLFVYAPADVDVIHTTITQNYNALYGGGVSVFNLANPTAPVTFTNSVIAGNGTGYLSPDCYMFSSAEPRAAFDGLNVIGETGAHCPYDSDPAVIVEPTAFDPVTNTSHPYVFPPAPGSVPINAAPSCLPILGGLDQMGNARPAGSGCDLGAYERPAEDDGSVIVTPTSGEPLSAFTITVTDPDLAAAVTIDVQVETQNTVTPDAETVTLTETSAGSGVFEAMVTLLAAPAAAGNGSVEAGLGHKVIVSYWDAITANADAATRTAVYDIVAPAAANLLTNGDFEAGSAGWTISATNGDKVKAKNPFDGAKAFMFVGGPGKANAKLSQKVVNPAIADEDTLTAGAQIQSTAAAFGKLQIKIATNTGRQTKASLPYGITGVYALHEIVVPIALLSGETITSVTVTFSDKSPGGKVYIDAAALSVTPPDAPRGGGRDRAEPGTLPPPASPEGFRGQN